MITIVINVNVNLNLLLFLVVHMFAVKIPIKEKTRADAPTVGVTFEHKKEDMMLDIKQIGIIALGECVFPKAFQ